MVYGIAIKKASLDELLKDERKIVLMYRLSDGLILHRKNKYQRFYWKYADAYDEYINKDPKNMEKIIMLVSKVEGRTSQEEFDSIIDRIDSEVWD